MERILLELQNGQSILFFIFNHFNRCAVKIQRIWRGYDDRTFAKLKRKHYIRASKIIWKAWRTHKLYKYVNGHYDYDTSRMVIKAYVIMKYIFNWRKY